MAKFFKMIFFRSIMIVLMLMQVVCLITGVIVTYFSARYVIYEYSPVSGNSGDTLDLILCIVQILFILLYFILTIDVISKLRKAIGCYKGVLSAQIDAGIAIATTIYYTLICAITIVIFAVFMFLVPNPKEYIKLIGIIFLFDCVYFYFRFKKSFFDKFIDL